MPSRMVPPTLDLSRSSHSKMIVSPPRLNLRRAASYNHEKGPLSATSSRFNFNHLLFASPPPSPSLPALIPRPRKSPTHPRPSRVLRLVIWFTGILLITYFAAFLVRRHGPVSAFRWLSSTHDNFEMVGQDNLPGFPTPIIVADSRGRTKWTVSIPPTYDFPLSIKEYSDMCSKCHIIATRVRDLRHKGHPSQQTPLDFDLADPNFVDVRDAEESGMLAGVAGNRWQAAEQGQDGDLVGENKDSLVEKPVCRSTMTFVLETADAGLGNTLMMMWTLYGLAKKQRRAFFIDDTRWAYGRYTDIFGAPPVPRCQPPLRHEMLPCPLQARHIVVSAATARGIFGGTLGVRGENSKDLKTLFGFAREGYEALFQINKEDRAYVDGRVRELTGKARTGDSSPNDGLVIGLHVRHGDQHPLEYQYRDSYIPLDTFAEKAREILDVSYNGTAQDSGDEAPLKTTSIIVVASDDPTVHESEELSGALEAQEYIRLASKSAIQKVNPDRHVMHHFVDETFGWEGGFFAAMFWNLGQSGMNAANGAAAALLEKTRLAPSAETLRLRSLIGRAYVMDLAVLSEASDAVICAVSATGCRLLAVMMGWESAMEKGNWINVDGNFGWTGISW
jgi:hypothetical protein